MMQNRELNILEINTPVGNMILGALDNYLCLCDWNVNRHRERNDNRIKRLLHHVDTSYIYNEMENSSILTIQRARQELDEYFSGNRKSFDVPLLMMGTDFQKRVWQALKNIPYGSTVSYKDIACRVGNPKGVRAVAQAIGANPLSIFVPCHRVVGSDGTLTGYAGGVDAKRFLLQLEASTRLW